jgi:hypothetical protein
MAGDQVGEPYRAGLGEQRQVIALSALLFPLLLFAAGGM